MPADREIGPVNVMAVRFPGSKLTGDIARSMQSLVDKGTVRILDLLFVRKDIDGSVLAVELDDLDADDASPYDDLDGEIGELLTEEDVALAAEGLEPGDSAAMIVWENVWAAELAAAVRAADGEIVMNEHLPGAAAILAYEERDAASQSG